MVMLSRTKIAALRVTPIEVVAKATRLFALALTNPDVGVPPAPAVPPKVLSIVMAPGNTMALVPIKLGFSAAPADLTV